MTSQPAGWRGVRGQRKVMCEALNLTNGKITIRRLAWWLLLAWRSDVSVAK